MEVALAAGQRGPLAWGRDRSCGGADIPGLPQGRAALPRLIVREGHRRAGRPRREGRALRREGATPELGIEPHLSRRGQEAGGIAASSPRGRRAWGRGQRGTFPRAGRGQGGCAGWGGPSFAFPRVGGMGLEGCATPSGVCAGEVQSGRGPSPQLSRLADPGLPSTESASGLRQRGGGRALVAGPGGQGRSPCGRSEKLKAWSFIQPTPVSRGGGTVAPTRRGNAVASFGVLRLASVH